MEIKPIVFNVPSAPMPQPAAKPSILPWLIVGSLVIALLVVGMRGYSDDGQQPKPVVNETVATTAQKDSRSYLIGVASVFDSLADKVDGKSITNDTQLQSNSRAATVAARDAAYVATNELDNAAVRGEYAGRESAVSAHLRSKAEGYRRAAR